MRHRLTPALMLLLLAACYGGESAPTPAQPEGDPNALRVLGGPGTCDSCESVMLSVKGAGIEDVIDARLVRQGRPDVELPAIVELRRFTGDSGRVLQVTVRIAGAVLAGDYDLRLRTFEADRELVVAPALNVSRSWVSPGSTPPVPFGGYGVLQLTASVSGEAVDSSLAIEFTTSFGTRTQDLRPGEPLTLAAVAGPLTLRLVHVARNCTVQSADQVTVTIVAGAATPVDFVVTCAAVASIRVSLAATGVDLPGGLWVECDDDRCDPSSLGANASVLLQSGIGPVTVRLRNVPGNCQVITGDALTLTLAAGLTSSAAFAINCLPRGIVRVSVRQDGAASSSAYVVQDDGACDWYYGCETFALTPPATVDYRPYSGAFALRLSSVPGNCTPADWNSVVGTVMPGETVAVEFVVTCR